MAGRDVPMSVRRLIVEVNVDGLNVREFCQQHGVSTWFFYDLRRRWRRDGDAVLEPQSRAPKRVWNKTASDVEDAAVAIRKRLRDAGLDYGPEEVAAALSRPQHPQTNGKVERFHHTEHKWLAAHEPVDTIADLQTLLDLFRHYYNHHRRHRGIGRHVPADVWTNAPKAGPADRPLRPPSTVHRARVINGVVGIYSYAITVGTAHTGNDTLTVITGTTCHVFIDGRLVRQLTLDPTRRVQPLHTRRLPGGMSRDTREG